jgi:hypothetical protein
MSGIKALRKIQLGKEATPGTQVVATAVYRGTGSLEDQRKMAFPNENIGLIVPSDAEEFTSQNLAEVTLGPDEASFEQLPYFLEAGIKKLAAPVADGGGTGKIYSYPLSLTSQNTIQALTIEGGDDNQVEFGTYFFAKEITLEGKWGEPLKASSKLTGQILGTGAYNTGTGIAFDNAHHITDSNSGFTVANGFASSMIIKVFGTTLNDGIYTVTARADGQLTVTENTATEAAGTLFYVRQWFTGGPTGLALPVVERIMFTKSKLFLDPVTNAIGTTQVSTLLKVFKLTFKTGINELGASNGTLNYSSHNITLPEFSLDLEFWANAAMANEKYTWRNNLPRVMRVQILGSALTTAGAYTYKTVNINAPGKWTKFTALQDQNGADFVTASFSGRYDPTLAYGPSLDVVNQLASLP